MARSGSELEAGFAKLLGEHFDFYMQTYSIMLGRNSRKSTVDVDLSYLGGGLNISRHHARIYYDFPRRRFALDVLGKNGCIVEGVHYAPGSPPVKLESQDLVKIGEIEFYFLLPVRNVVGGPIAPRLGVYASPHPPPAPHQALAYHAPSPALGWRPDLPYGPSRRERTGDYSEEASEEEDVAVGRAVGDADAGPSSSTAAGAGIGRKKSKRAVEDAAAGPSDFALLCR